jgi:hypothetical protein
VNDPIDAIAAALSGGTPPGLYRLSGQVAADRVGTIAREKGFAFLQVRGASITDKRSFLDACAAAFKFPPTFGHNWDALEDLLRDLEWVSAPGYVVLYEDPARFAKADPKDWATALDIFRKTVTFWEGQQTPLWIFFSGRTDGLDDIPLLTA